MNILGFSAATVGMLLEAIASSTDDSPQVTIWRNVDTSAEVPYLVKGLDVSLSPVGTASSSLESCILGVYKPEVKKAVLDYFNRVTDELKFTCVIHHQSTVASSASIANGVFINPRVTLAPYCKLMDHVTVNRNASIGHHTMIGSFATINPGVHVAGHCTIGERVTLGMGALVTDGVSIGEGSIIGAGSVVTRDIPAGVKALGVPCKVIAEI